LTFILLFYYRVTLIHIVVRLSVCPSVTLVYIVSKRRNTWSDCAFACVV